MTDIAMLSCNRARITELAIRELVRRTTSSYRLIVLDNGSVDESPEMLEKLCDEGLVHDLQLLEENTGVHFGFNALLDMVDTDPYVCTDNDLVPQAPCAGKDWLAHLLDLSSLYPEYAAIACRPHVLIGERGDKFDRSPEINRFFHIGAHLRLMKADVVRQIGGWKDEKAPSRNNEDWHIGRLLTDAGWKLGYARDIRCIHLFGEGDEDPWGYPDNVLHGHRDIWPPVNHSSWGRKKIDWRTCK